MKLLSTLALVVVVAMLSACTGPLATLTSGTVSRHDVLLAIDAANAVEDTATAAMSGCLATHSHVGLCAASVLAKTHTALVAMRTPRDQLNLFAQNHGDTQLGVTGLYDAVISSKDALLGILQTYGAAAPPGVANT